MGQRAKSRRALERKKKLRGIKEAKKRRYEAYALSGDNSKRARRDNKKGKPKLRLFRQRKRGKVLVEVEIPASRMSGGFITLTITGKQYRNTVSLKQYLKML